MCSCMVAQSPPGWKHLWKHIAFAKVVSSATSRWTLLFVHQTQVRMVKNCRELLQGWRLGQASSTGPGTGVPTRFHSLWWEDHWRLSLVHFPLNRSPKCLLSGQLLCPLSAYRRSPKLLLLPQRTRLSRLDRWTFGTSPNTIDSFLSQQTAVPLGAVDVWHVTQRHWGSSRSMQTVTEPVAAASTDPSVPPGPMDVWHIAQYH
jgi:hypothetical protein